MAKMTALPWAGCDGGFYNDTSGTGSCKECAPTTYSPGGLATQCFPCGADSVDDGLSGKVAADQCECQSGYRLTIGEAGMCVSCGARRYSLCPGSAGCSHESLTSGGWFPSRQALSRSIEYLECPIPEYCTGDLCGDALCRTNHANGFFCSNCDSGYSKPIFPFFIDASRSKFCSTCASTARTFAIFAGSTLFTLLLIFLLARQARRVLVPRVGSLPRDHRALFGPKVTLALSAFQYALNAGGVVLSARYGASNERLVGTAVTRYSEALLAASMNWMFWLDAAGLFGFGCQTLGVVPGDSVSIRRALILLSLLVCIVMPLAILVLVVLVHLFRLRQTPVTVRGRPFRESSEEWVRLCSFDALALLGAMLVYLVWTLMPLVVRVLSANVGCSRRELEHPQISLAPEAPCTSVAELQITLVGVVVVVPLLLMAALYYLARRNLLQAPRVLFVFGTFFDGYRMNYVWAPAVKLLAVNVAVTLSLLAPNMAVRAKCLVLAAPLFLLILLANQNPYKSAEITTTPADSPRLHGVQAFLQYFRSRFHVVETIVLGCQTLSFFLLANAATRTSASAARALVGLAATLAWVPVGLLTLDIAVSDIFQPLLRDVWRKPAEATESATSGDKSGANAVRNVDGLYDALMLFRERCVHALGSEIQRELRDIVLTSPFPAETLAQLSTLNQDPDFLTLVPKQCGTQLMSLGFVEPQAATVLLLMPLLQHLFTKATRLSNLTSDTFREDVAGCMEAIVSELGLKEQVERHKQIAATIMKEYALIWRVAKPRKEFVSWKTALEAQSELDVRLKWIKAQRDVNLKPEDVARAVAEFKHLFPDAAPVHFRRHRADPQLPIGREVLRR